MTGQGEPLIAEFADHGRLQPGGWYVFPPSIALQIIAQARLKDVGLLGLDAFVLGDQSIQPVMEFGTNYSAFYDTEPERAWSDAERHITELKDQGLWFELVLD